MNNKQECIGTKLKSSMLKATKEKKSDTLLVNKEKWSHVFRRQKWKKQLPLLKSSKMQHFFVSGFKSNFSLNNSVFNFENYFGRSRSSSPQRAMNKQCMAVLDIFTCRWTMNHFVICNKYEIYR